MLKCLYDNNRDSDSIMLLRIYEEWVSKFHRYLITRGQSGEEAHKFDGRKVFIEKPKKAER